MTRIRELREKLDIKQEEIAVLCNVNQSTVSLWESGKTVPRKKALGLLAERFGVTVGYLLGVEGNEDEAEIGDIDFALSGEIRDLTNDEKQDILDYVKFKKAQKARQ